MHSLPKQTGWHAKRFVINGKAYDFSIMRFEERSSGPEGRFASSAFHRQCIESLEYPTEHYFKRTIHEREREDFNPELAIVPSSGRGWVNGQYFDSCEAEIYKTGPLTIEEMFDVAMFFGLFTDLPPYKGARVAHTNAAAAYRFFVDYLSATWLRDFLGLYEIREDLLTLVSIGKHGPKISKKQLEDIMRANEKFFIQPLSPYTNYNPSEKRWNASINQKFKKQYISIGYPWMAIY